MTKKLLTILCLAGILSANAQILPPSPSMWVSGELNHKFGTGQTTGQAVAFYPNNVIGPPPTNAEPENPSYMMTDIVSLGKDGYIALSFFPSLLNGPGYDFIVFENVLRIPNNGDFQEWATVEASIDGTTWVKFPIDSITGQGFAGRNVTYGNSATFKDTSKCGGDAFDLGSIGLDSAKYIRLTDATIFQRNKGCTNCSSPDIDAIAAVWQVGEDTTAVNGVKNRNAFLVKTFYTKNELIINKLLANSSNVAVYDISGKIVFTQKINGYTANIPTETWTKGLYIVQHTNDAGQKTVQKVSIY